MNPSTVAEPQSNPPVRGTQLLVAHIGSAFLQPSLLGIEIAWRWLFGIPFLWVCWQQAQRIFAEYPLESSGLDSLDTQNPWVAASQIANGFAYYAPHVLAAMQWLLPAAAVCWIVISGFGRAWLLHRFDPRIRFRPLKMMAFSTGWLVVWGLVLWGWLCSVQWVAATHIRVAGEPDLLGYFIWIILLSLGFFTIFALLSWPVSIAPILAGLEDRPALSALGESWRLGKSFTGKLIEINLVLGIVKLALIVLAMVLSAAPLPFGDELGGDTLHMVSAAAIVFYLAGCDFFQVVRIKAFLEFWKVFRAPESA